MKKKGEMSFTAIVIGVVALLVLVIVFINLFPWIVGKMSFFQFGFEGDDTLNEKAGILRYNLDDGKLEYYDGDKFFDFTGKSIKVKNGKIFYDSVKSDIENYISDDFDLVIYNARFKLAGSKYTNYDVEVTLKEKEEIVSPPNFIDKPLYYGTNIDGKLIYYRYITDKAPSRGWEWAQQDALIWRNGYSSETINCRIGSLDLSKNNCEIMQKLKSMDKTQGANFVSTKGDSYNLRVPYNGENIIIGSKGEFYYKGSRVEDAYGNYELLIREEVVKWRDNLLRNSILIQAELDKELEGPRRVLYVCPEIVDGKYIVLRLEKEAVGGSCLT
ncbi:MAG: hypothetical protein Q7S27_04345 [Nanoarchaeota archaeon]|nr:hypothetical protein [Nanoarchaeota archaeon]